MVSKKVRSRSILMTSSGCSCGSRALTWAPTERKLRVFAVFFGEVARHVLPLPHATHQVAQLYPEQRLLDPRLRARI